MDESNLNNTTAATAAASPLQVNIVSKEMFCKILNHIKSQNDLFEELNKTLEKICPGFYTNVYPNCKSESIILEILDSQFGFTPSDSLIDYFVYDLNFGQDTEMIKNLSADGKPIDISTPEKLYDFLIEDMRNRQHKES